MTFLMPSSSKPAPPCMLMIPSCTVLFHSEGLWYSVQQDLASLNIWSHETKMKFNASKCKVLTVTWKKTPVTHDYLLGDVNLQRVQEEIDLGVTISRMLRAWPAPKVNRMLGLLKRTCPLITDMKARRTLFLSLVKSQLSYATEVYSPVSINLRTILARVRRRAELELARCPINNNRWLFAHYH